MNEFPLGRNLRDIVHGYLDPDQKWPCEVRYGDAGLIREVYERYPRDGDLIKRPLSRAKGIIPGLDHYGLFFRSFTVYHFDTSDLNPNGVKEVCLTGPQDFSLGARIRIVEYEDHPSREPDDICREAERLLGFTGYDLLACNCEHFASWCKYGKPFSVQGVSMNDVAVFAKYDREAIRNQEIDRWIAQQDAERLRDPEGFARKVAQEMAEHRRRRTEYVQSLIAEQGGNLSPVPQYVVEAHETLWPDLDYSQDGLPDRSRWIQVLDKPFLEWALSLHPVKVKRCAQLRVWGNMVREYESEHGEILAD